MLSEARQKKIMEKLNRAQKCSFLTGSSTPKTDINSTGQERLIRSHSSARFCFELSGNSN